MSRLFLKDVATWTASDLDALIEAQVPEGMRVEYKRELKLDTKAQKAEAAKDVSGLANAQGGWLIFGVDEDDSEEPLPTAVSALSPDGIQTRLENVLDSTLEPRAEFHAATIQVDGGIALVVRVEPKSGDPIMVQGYGEYRYYRRSGTRTRRMTATEVSESHALAKQREEALFEVLAALPLKSRLTRRRSVDEARLALEGQSRTTWLPLATVLVAAVDCPRPLMRPEHLSADAFPEPSEGQRRRSPEVRPPGRWTLDAFGLHQEEIYDPDSPELAQLAHRVAIFRPGVVEWARRYRIDNHLIPGKTLAENVHDALRYAAGVFAEVGYFGRLATHVRIENAEGAIPHVPVERILTIHPAGVEWIGHSREVAVDELLLDATPTVRQAMDVIWQGFGVVSCPYFDQSGAWADV